ncbi:hypothetical protein A6A04_02860 [Paramagnetospirillum marisnigri]|uniref:Uncharacterized protein n=1 Tax=Paramagnetospirillum marisnigri TaxID=1285242 RepID=A0A178MP33_9PROT|nr:CsgG/HfaB family protein [Paramagnetospirillum marisnigri]OAN50351.1 hypothetical protein A6A04_02860 [Paramagnetospirillum marisnigri]
MTGLFRFLACGDLAVAGCATPDYPKTPVEAKVAAAAQQQAMQAQAAPVTTKLLKRKVAIGRFSNETRYGRTFVRSDSGDPLGKHVSDMLGSRLLESGAFMVFERPDLDKVVKEQQLVGPGARQGLKVGDLLTVMQPGEQIKSGQSGFTVSLPATELATIRIVAQFGDSDTNEGSVAELVSGTLAGRPIQSLFITDKRGG